MTTETEPKWQKFLKDNKWTTYLANELKNNSTNPKETLLKYEALLTQCSYLSRMAYCPADIFCRMTQHLDVTPNAFNNYIRAIEKIYDRLFNYKCSFDSKYIQKHPEFSKYFEPIVGEIPAPKKNGNSVGIGAQNNNTGEVKTVNSALNKNGNNVGIVAPNNPEEVKPVNSALRKNGNNVGIVSPKNNPEAVNTGSIPATKKNGNNVRLPAPNIPEEVKTNSGGAESNNTKKEDTKTIGFFVQNNEHMNMYLYVHHNLDSKFNTKKTLFIAFKGSSSIEDFKHDLKSAAYPDKLLSELSNAQNTQETVNPNSNTQNKKNKPGKAGYGFIKTLKPSINDICKKIEELKSRDNFERVIITGHSLGGALASLFGYYLMKYNPTLIDKPIHVITFGACCVFDAVGRNEFNAFLNIEDEKQVFTLDRVTSNLDPVIGLPIDLDHPGFTIPRDEFYSYKNTKRTKEIGELRDLLELKEKKGIDLTLTADDLLSTEEFVSLFSNFDALKVNDKYDEELYKKKFKINFGTKAEEQYPILDKAMPDAKLKKIQELFKSIEKRKKNKLVNIPQTKAKEQAGGIYNPLLGGSNASNKYKKEVKKRMPNQIQYSCYAKMAFRFCHASYMGVSYVMVLRLPNISEGKLRKEPTKD